MTTTQDDTIATGAKVRLRPKRLADAPNDYAWRADHSLARYDAARPLSQSYEDFHARYTDDLLRPQLLRRTFAVDTLDGVHIGNVIYYNIDLARRETELGVTIGDTAFWGGGYGTEAVRLLVDYIFTETALTRIYLHTLDWNLRAQRSFASVGFRDCGRTRRGEYRFHLMELRREWLWDREYQRRAAARR